MNQTAVAQVSSPKLVAYSELLRRVRKTLLLAQTKINHIKVKAYWETGRWIHAHVLHHKDRAGYDQQVVVRLSRELNVSKDSLYRYLRFYRANPIVATSQQLTWSHFLEFLRIEDPRKRLEFETRAAREDWTIPELRAKIRRIQKQSVSDTFRSVRHPLNLLTPRKGKLGIYQLVKEGEGLSLDLGFTSYKALGKDEARGFKDKDLVTFSGGKIKKAKGASVKDLFTYEADILKLADGDTHWYRIWLKRPLWLKEKLRLRGIDCPELYKRGVAAPYEMSKSRRAVLNPPGLRAKRFVEAEFKKAKKILIATTKPDKWDRYLSDVFLIQADGSEVFLNNLLLERGLARRYDDVSPEDWEE